MVAGRSGVGRLVVPLALVGCAAAPAPLDLRPLIVTPVPRQQQLSLAPSIIEVSAVPTPEPERPPPPQMEATPPAKGTVVLHVGDSFVHAGLTQRLRQLFEPHGVHYFVRAKASTISLDWARRLPMEIAQTQPDLVIVTLGANEIRSRYLDVQARAIRRIGEAMGDRPCVWTTPPLWLEETGFFDTLQANAAPCRFFETDREVGTFLPRRDKVHPTLEGGAVWANRLFDYLLEERAGDAKQPWLLEPSPDDELTPRGHRQPLPQERAADDDPRGGAD